MSNTKSTKRALLTSAMAMILCLAMLIGTTFAWFTDSASTGVNKVQAGTLDIQLLDAEGNEVETLSWQKAEEGKSEEILWEPGCTYNLQSFKIKNNGNLALKYKIKITGINGSDKLNEAITWSYTDAESYAVDINQEGKLAADATTGLITISGTMDENAGNEYQGLSIDSIAITVLATQDTVEYDSSTNLYDANATYNEMTIDCVEFYVLKTEGTKKLLLTKENVTTMTFSENDGIDEVKSEWRTSDLREFLNNEWLESYPTLSKLASETTLYTVTTDSVSATEPEFYSTTDKVFLLSEADVNGTSFCDINKGTGDVVTDSRYYTSGSQLTPPDGSWTTSSEYGWWLRSPSHWGYTVAYLDNDSEHAQGQSYACEGIGVRPALWIDLG